MSFSIALSGKGGAGKTTIAALIVKHFLAGGQGPVFAVDADPNSNLADSLGVKQDGSVGDLREELLKERDSLPAGMSKADWIGYRLQEIVVESDGFDLLSMGRPEGPGCYCYVNSLLREYLDSRAKNYPRVVIDNEAGMEHLSRRTTRDVDTLLVVTDLTPVSLTAALRIAGLGQSLPLRIKRIGFVVNRANAVPDAMKRTLAETGLPVFGVIPPDPAVEAFSLEGRPLLGMREDSVAYRAVARILDALVG